MTIASLWYGFSILTRVRPVEELPYLLAGVGHALSADVSPEKCGDVARALLNIWTMGVYLLAPKGRQSKSKLC